MMGNAIGSFFSGFGHVIGNLFGSQLDFLSGKSCNSLCGPTWDLTCYIENFCIEHLLKLFAVSFLFYVVLLLFYSLYKLGICQCVSRSLCKMVWACFSAFFSMWEHGCYFLCRKLFMVKHERRRHKNDVEMLDMSSTSDETSFYDKEPYRNIDDQRRLISCRSRNHKRNHLRKSLRPRNHRVRVGVDGDSVYVTKRKRVKHGDIRVIQTSSFAKRGRNHKRSRNLHKRIT